MSNTFFDFVKTLKGQSNVTLMNMNDLAANSNHTNRETVHGGKAFFSNIRNRSGKESLVVGNEHVQQKNLSPYQKSMLSKLDTTLNTLRKYLEKAPLICTERTIGSNSTFNPKCTLFLSTQRRDNIRQAFLWANTLRRCDPTDVGPEIKLICIPEWPEQDRQILLFPEHKLTVVLGSDYVGEVKMGFLRMAMWCAKQEGMLSLHAGSKVIKARDIDGEIKTYGMLLFGLSGTGKTTHSCHDHGLNGTGEGMEILQDDIVFLQKDGAALGTEQGFYLKTEGVTSEKQPIIYKSLASPGALFENVMVDHQGNMELDNLSFGSNGRAIISRDSLSPYTLDRINMPSIDQLDGLIICFVTRRMTVLPIVSKLNIEQSAATFMLGESIETSAGDPKRAGQSVRVVGTNPFLIGNPSDEGNWFYDFLQHHQSKIQCYLLNTGGVGEIRSQSLEGNPEVSQPSLRIAIPEMASILRGIARGTVEWEIDSEFNTEIPVRVPNVDMSKFDPGKFYTKQSLAGHVKDLKLERKEWLNKFPELNKNISTSLS